jgi:hypothetical protein
LITGPNMKANRKRYAAAVLALSFAAALALAAPARAEIIVRLEVMADNTSVHLDPSESSPVVETLPRGAVLKQASPVKFRTCWIYVQFASSRSGRMLSGYVPDAAVRKLNSTLKVVDLTPQDDEIVNPRDFDLSPERLPRIKWGVPEESILKAEGRPLSREYSGDLELLHYHREVLGKKCLLCYVMAERKLVSLRIHLLERYVEKDLHVADYNKIKSFLYAKVGEPRYDNVVWKHHACAACAGDLGKAVMSGGLCMSSEWEFQDTGLRLSLTGDTGGILLAAEINAIKATNQASF